MSLPNSLGAYLDCRALYDAALADPKGARACLGTYESCLNMRTRMHYFRMLDRKANADAYPVGSHMHGTSIYDDYVVRIQRDTNDEFWLYIQPRSGQVLAIEGLSEVEDLIEVDGGEVGLLEGPSNG